MRSSARARTPPAPPRYDHLSPTLCKAAWTEAEDMIIELGYASYGRCWSKIASMLGRRSSHAVRNRYSSLHRNDHIDSAIGKPCGARVDGGADSAAMAAAARAMAAADAAAERAAQPAVQQQLAFMCSPRAKATGEARACASLPAVAAADAIRAAQRAQLHERHDLEIAHPQPMQHFDKNNAPPVGAPLANLATGDGGASGVEAPTPIGRNDSFGQIIDSEDEWIFASLDSVLNATARQNEGMQSRACSPPAQPLPQPPLPADGKDAAALAAAHVQQAHAHQQPFSYPMAVSMAMAMAHGQHAQPMAVQPGYTFSTPPTPHALGQLPLAPAAMWTQRGSSFAPPMPASAWPQRAPVAHHPAAAAANIAAASAAALRVPRSHLTDLHELHLIANALNARLEREPRRCISRPVDAFVSAVRSELEYAELARQTHCAPAGGASGAAQPFGATAINDGGACAAFWQQHGPTSAPSAQVSTRAAPAGSAPSHQPLPLHAHGAPPLLAPRASS